MVQAGFESRIKIHQIIENQLPGFLLSESSNTSEFLKQYYKSQEYQGGPVDIAENLDQYLRFDNLTPDVIVNSTTLTSDITNTLPTSDADDGTVYVESTRGFPSQYGLLKIVNSDNEDDFEIVTYTGVTANSFTGCIGGFSGITNYHNHIDQESLIFSSSTRKTHKSGSKVENLSALFLKEFYRNLKATFVPELENIDFNDQINAGNFIRHARSFYQSKGTNESFRILFNVLYGVNPKIINLEEFLIKSSSASYIRREVVVIDIISSGDPKNLFGQTIVKTNDSSTFASVSSVETFERNSKLFYKLELFVGYNDSNAVSGNFKITPSTRVLENVSQGSNAISVDSTIGFPESGTIFVGSGTSITYTGKSINQFYGCDTSNISNISSTDVVRSNDTYYGYENGDSSKKIEFIILGSLSKFNQLDSDFDADENDKIYISNLGRVIENNNATYEEVLANSWIYNVCPSFLIEFGTSDNENTISSTILFDKPIKDYFRKGDVVEILNRGTNTVVHTTYISRSIVDKNSIVIDIAEGYDYGQGLSDDDLSGIELKRVSGFELRRKIRKSGRTSSAVEFEFGDDSIISDVQNTYLEHGDSLYVASNSLPSGNREVIDANFQSSYDIQENIKICNTSKLKKVGSNYSIIEVSDADGVPFITGDKVFYIAGTENPIAGLSARSYYVEKISSNELKLYGSVSFIGTDKNLTFDQDSSVVTGNKLVLYSHRDLVIGPQKILKKFPITQTIKNSSTPLTQPGTVGMMVNGVEISNYKSHESVYYGPLSRFDVLSGGSDYDVINLPGIELSSSNGTTALVQPVVSGSVKDVFVDPQEFNIDKIVSVNITGGNGQGAVIEPILIKKQRDIFFDGRESGRGGGISTSTNTIVFLKDHNLVDGDKISYNNSGNSSLGIGTTSPSVNGTTFFIDVINSKAIRLHDNISDALSGINTVGLTTTNTFGIHKFLTTDPNNTVLDIKVVNEGSGYTNRKLIVKSSGISTVSDTITFENHNFKDGDLIEYLYESSIVSGLSTNNQYYVLNIDSDSFRLCDAGIGGTITSNYEKQKYVNLTSSGSGYQYFKYPDISASLSYTSITSDNVTDVVKLTPVVRGSIVDAYLYESGTGYGSTIPNHQKNPLVSIKNGSSARFRPVIVNGTIQDVSILYGGKDYNSSPDLEVVDPTNLGNGARLRPVITNGSITDVIVVNTGIGYSTASSIKVTSSGIGALFDTSVRELTINNNRKYKNSLDVIHETELLVESENKIKYTVSGYSTAFLNNGEGIDSHSPIIGWAYDGNPIFGPYGYSDPNDIESDIKLIVPGYTLSETNIIDRPSGFDYGFFVDDYVYDNSVGDLDEHNGRFTKVRGLFENGVYGYFATIEDSTKSNVAKYPYFIGNRYRSDFIKENNLLDQSFDFNNSNLIRNTSKYNIKDKNVDYDFVFESAKLSDQLLTVESVTSGSVENVEILSSGSRYKINDNVKFKKSGGDQGDGLSLNVSELEGKSVVDVESNTLTYENSIFEWNNSKEVEVTIQPSHILSDSDKVTISGFSTESELNGNFEIGVKSKTTVLLESIPSTASIGSTDIFVESIPSTLNIGSFIKIGTESLEIFNFNRESNFIRVNRGSTGVSHTTGTVVEFTPDSFTIDVNTPHFNSNVNNKVYFNPNEVIGFGTVVGFSSSVTVSFGATTKEREILTQSIFIENHPFTDNQKITISIPHTNSERISISTSPAGSTTDLPSTAAGLSTNVFVSNKGRDIIGIKTTLNSDEVFFIGIGVTDGNDYKIESNYTQVLGKVERVLTTVSVSTSHGMLKNDVISLSLQPNLNVGIGTSTSVKLRRSDYFGVVANRETFVAGGISVETNSITISSHGFKTGDKVGYSKQTSSEDSPGGLIEFNSYYIYRINDDTIKLCDTYIDSQKNPPTVVEISSVGGSTDHYLDLINPQIDIVSGNNLVFDLSDSTLSGYEFKIFNDNEFKNEFVSTGSTNNFSIISSPNVGSAGAALTITHSENIPNVLFYNLEKSGYISTSDIDVKNNNKISYINSVYSNEYTVTGTGTTTFDIVLRTIPERNSYLQSECDVLKYTTTSKTAEGAIAGLKIMSKGSGYKKLPVFDAVTSTNGKDANLIAKSSLIGNVNQTRIVNSGFNYPSDKTLRPSASSTQALSLINANTIGIVSVTNGGSDYINEPSLIIVDSTTNKKIDSGLLKANLLNSTIQNVDIVSEPTGLPEKNINLFTTNNTNGVTIREVLSSNTGIFTCVLTTPAELFGADPFTAGDLVFIEGIQKYSSGGDGFNTEDLQYQFLKVQSYDGPPSNNSVNPAKLTIDVNELTSNTGIAITDQQSKPIVIKKTDYPSFTIQTEYKSFIVDEQLIVNGVLRDLFLTSEVDKNKIKVGGTYEVSKGDVLIGSSSGSKATVFSSNNNSGEFEVNYNSPKNIGWSDDTGKLSNNTQYLPDNDYYQNLSYSVKSPIEYQKSVSVVNDLVHTIGTKNFSDTEIIGVAKTVGVSTDSAVDSTTTYVDIIDDRRVDTLMDIGLAIDSNISNNQSNFIEFSNLRLSQYTEISGDLVFTIDNINNQFSNLKDRENLKQYLDLFAVRSLNYYSNLLIKITDNNNNQVQLSDLVLFSNQNGNYLLERSELYNNFEKPYGKYSLEYSDVDSSKVYFRFTPDNEYAFNYDYNVEILDQSFIGNSVGVNTYSIGEYIDLISSTQNIETTETNIVSLNKNSIESLYAEIQITDLSTGKINFSEIYLIHDGTNTYISETNTDSSNILFNSDSIVSFASTISSNDFILKCSNNTSNNVKVKSRIVGFGATDSNSGTGSYTFLATNQPESSAKTIKYQTNYVSGTGDQTILTLDSSDFAASKIIVQVSTGTEKSLHQLLLVQINNNAYVHQDKFNSIDQNEEYSSIGGIGTFGTDYNSSNYRLKFYPDSDFSSDTIEVTLLSQNFYKDIDVNIPNNLEYGNVTEKLSSKTYYGINSDSLNKNDFELTTEFTPIFAKKFDPSDTNVVSNSGIFTIENHFFRTGEKLLYREGTTFGGSATKMESASSTDFPEEVFVHVLNKSQFKLMATKANAIAGTSALTVHSRGTGNSHELEMELKNEKTLITVDNIIQSPIAYCPISYTLSNGINSNDTVFALSGITSIRENDVLRLDNKEYVKVINSGLGTLSSGPITGTGTNKLVQVERGFLGTNAVSHTSSKAADIYRGSYNIEGNKIFFTEPPRGEANVERNESNLEVPTSDFAGRVYFKSNYDDSKVYDDISHQFTGIGKTFTVTVGGANTSGIGTLGRSGLLFINGFFQAPSTPNNTNNNFDILETVASGGDPGITTVVFTGINEPINDDINVNEVPRGGIVVSYGFTGGLGYAPLVGASVTAILGAGGSITSFGYEDLGSGYYGSVGVAVTDLIYDHKFVSCGVNSITDNTGSEYTATDAIYNSLTGDLILTIPRHGLDLSNTVGIDNGGIVFTCSKDGHGSEHAYPRAISKTQLRRGNSGVGDPISGILTAITAKTNNTITINVHPGGGAGTGGQVTAAVGAGGTLTFSLVGHGTDYVNPEIYVNSPSYANLGISGISRLDGSAGSGQGLKISVDVGSSSTTGIGSTYFEVKDISIHNNGYEFRKGDKVSVTGLVTDQRLGSPIEPLVVEILETYTDSFSMWEFGDLDYADSIEPFQDGFRKNFILRYDNEIISFEGRNNESINFENLLLIFVNGILQTPGKAYTFNGGTSFTFADAPKIEDKVDIYFYRGITSEDSSAIIPIYKTIEEGDQIQGIATHDDEKDQSFRTVYAIESSDTLQTNLYSGDGISENEKSINLIKQKSDSKIGGQFRYKTRESLKSLIYPTANIIKDLNTSSTTLYVDNSELFKNYVSAGEVYQMQIVSQEPVSSACTITSSVGAGGTVVLSLVSGGSGYSSAPTIKIAAPPIIGVGIGTTAQATLTINSGSVDQIQITNPGFGYTIAPNIIVSVPSAIKETVTGITSTNTKGFTGIITGIDTKTDSGQLYIEFDLYSKDINFASSDLQVGDAIVVFDTTVGSGITSIDNSSSSIVGVGTTFIDNIYYISESPSGTTSTGIVTCKIQNGTSTTGLAISGNVGRFSWGRIENVTRSSSPASFTVSGKTIDVGFSTFPVGQRRGSGDGAKKIGIRDSGSLD